MGTRSGLEIGFARVRFFAGVGREGHGPDKVGRVKILITPAASEPSRFYTPPLCIPPITA